MGSLSDLLRYKESLMLRDERRDKDLKKVWVRLLGDEDLKEAFRFSRIVSAKKRAALKDKDSVDFLDDVAQLSEQPRTELVDIIVASKEHEFTNESTVIVDKEELPEISEIAKQPDAPSLEEQEQLDSRTEEQEQAYQAKIKDYIDTKTIELKAELESLTEQEIIERAATELINIQALQAFLDELNDQKGFRGTYTDEPCKVRGFTSVEDFRSANSGIKQQILDKYSELELGNDDIKN